MGEGRIRCAFDREELERIEEKLRVADEPDFQKDVIISEVELWEKAFEKNPDAANELHNGSFPKRMSQLVERSTVYMRSLGYLDERLYRSDDFLDRKVISHLVVPLLIEELEGPVRWSVFHWDFSDVSVVGRS